MTDEILLRNKASWNAMADSWFGTTALPAYGCAIPSEEELGLFPDLHGKKVLDIGCGSGHSLKWCGERGASELWGLDLSEKQIENAGRFLKESGCAPHLFCSPMEAECGLPTDYFDVVCSIYAVGWSRDLAATFHHVASYLRRGGIFLFSWDHPLMHCVDAREGSLVFSGCYLDDDDFSYTQRGQAVTVKNRKMSTYINALADTGFCVERLVEETDSKTRLRPAEFSSDYYAPFKAQKFPLSFVIRARKL